MLGPLSIGPESRVHLVQPPPGAARQLRAITVGVRMLL
jgi:hypothetical protein